MYASKLAIATDDGARMTLPRVADEHLRPRPHGPHHLLGVRRLHQADAGLRRRPAGRSTWADLLPAAGARLEHEPGDTKAGSPAALSVTWSRRWTSAAADGERTPLSEDGMGPSRLATASASTRTTPTFSLHRFSGSTVRAGSASTSASPPGQWRLAPAAARGRSTRWAAPDEPRRCLPAPEGAVARGGYGLIEGAGASAGLPALAGRCRAEALTCSARGRA